MNSAQSAIDLRCPVQRAPFLRCSKPWGHKGAHRCDGKPFDLNTDNLDRFPGFEDADACDQERK